MLQYEPRESVNRIPANAIFNRNHAAGTSWSDTPRRGHARGDDPSPLESRQRLHVLLVSHSDRDAAQVLMALRAGGFKVRHERVTDADALRSAMAAQRCNIVIAEFRMPGWGDQQVLQLVQAGAPELPVILICGAVGEDAAVLALKQGASDCIGKAQLHTRLASSVQSAFDHLHERSERRRRNRETALLADRSAQALAALPVAIYSCDPQGCLLHCNRAATELLGWEPEVGKDVCFGPWKIFAANGEELSALECPMAVTLRTGIPVSGIELVIERADGTRRRVMPHPQLLRDASGQFIGVVNMLIDLTEPRQQEQRLLQSEAASRTMFDSSQVALMRMLPGSRITGANDKMVELSGYSQAEMLGRTVEELGMRIDDQDGERYLAVLHQSGAAARIDVSFRCKDGTLRRVLVSTRTVAVVDVEQRLHSFVDITEQKNAIDQARLVNQALASISQGVLISGADHLTLSVNNAFESLTGYMQQEMLGRSCSILQGDDTNPATVQCIRDALDSGQAFNGEILNYRKDGSAFWNELSINPVRNNTGQLTHFVGIQRDVSEHRAHQSQLKLVSQIFAQSREGVAVTDARDKIVLVNQAFSAISGFEAADVLGRSPKDFASSQHDKELNAKKWQAIRETGSWQGETVGRRKDGSEYPEWLSISAIRDDNGDVCNHVRTFSDLSAEQAANERIAWLSQFDALTGLPNRNLLAERCNHDIDLMERESRPMALIVIGIDRFKNVNDTMGSTAGDKLLCKFAERLTQAVREQDTVARVGGDEFVVVLPGDDADGAGLLAERLVSSLCRPFEVNDSSVRVTPSIGIAIYPRDGLAFETLFKSAQVAMHQIKEDLRGRYRFFSSEMLESTLQQATMIAALRQAVEREQLLLHYQPFVDLQTGRIAGMEALLRWTHPELGAVSPAVFIPLAEQSSLIVELGNWVLRQACLDLREWRAAGVIAPPVSVNLSPAKFGDPALLQTIQDTLREHGIEPGQICLELTEGAVMEDVALSEKQMHALKGAGIKLALDDFGTGYSSLSYLKLFPFDKVKIDQSFVRNLLTSTQDAVIAKVVIAMAHGLGLRVIAEGVETEAQCEFMRANVCDEIQGYFFSRPIPMPAMQALLLEDLRLAPHLMREQLKPRTLLLVDDEPNVISALRRLLRGDGYQILSANSAPEGLELLARNPVDIIVSDQRMPGMTGVEFLRQAKSLYPGTMRIVLSDHTELQPVTDAINEGAVYRFLIKPWDDEQLREFIQDAFRHKELANENERLNLKVKTANQELASSNRQLQEVVDLKQRQLTRGQHSLDVMHEALQAIPMPVIALDNAGMIAFVNDQARHLFNDPGPLLASEIADVLPEIDALMDGTANGDTTATIDDHTYRVLWRAMGASSSSSGSIITLRLDEGTSQP